MNTSPHDRASQNSALMTRLQILFCSLGIPLLICAINTVLIKAGFWTIGPAFLPLCFTLFVLEVAVIAWCSGRYIDHPVLTWAVFLWSIAFVDANFMLLRFTHWDFESVGYSFASAQLGLLIAWAVLGTAGLGMRVFAALLGFIAVMTFVVALTTGLVSRQPYWWRNDWDTILTWQAIATLLLCAALRWRGFRILSTQQQSEDKSDREEDSKSEPVQFSILHLLMWTSALAPIFALARLVDWSSFELSYGLRMAQFTSLAALLSFTSLVAIWAGIGSGHVIVRLLVSVLLIACGGAAVGYASNRGWMDTLDLDMYLVGSQAYVFWITWTMLAGLFYVAMLMFLRAGKHRLARRS